MSTQIIGVNGNIETQHLPDVTRSPPVVQPINESVPFVDALVDATVGQEPIMDNRQLKSTQLVVVEVTGNSSLAYTAGDTTTGLQGRFLSFTHVIKIPHTCM